MSAGSPQQTLAMNPDVPVYNFQGQYDPIPRLDLGGMRSDLSIDPASNVTNITLPHSGSGVGDLKPQYTHLQATYASDIAALQREGAPSQATQDLSRLEEELGMFFVGKTTSHTVEFGREVGN